MEKNFPKIASLREARVVRFAAVNIDMYSMPRAISGPHLVSNHVAVCNVPQFFATHDMPTLMHFK